MSKSAMPDNTRSQTKRKSARSATVTATKVADENAASGAVAQTATSQTVSVAPDGKDVRVDVQVNSQINGVGATMRKQALFWFGAMAVFILFLTAFSSILLPFVAGLSLAYFLDPVADRLERYGMSRLLATIFILITFVLILVLGLIILIPVLVTQLADLIAKFPGYLTQLQALVARDDSKWLQKYLGIDNSVIQNNLSSFLKQGASFLSTLLQSLWSSGKSLIDLAGLFVVTPVVAFYMLLDWDRMVNSIDSWVPRDHVKTVRQIAKEMNSAIAGFIRGQGTLCLILGTFYAIGLTLTGLNFGLLIGLFAGLISFIPYIGSLVGLVLAISVALVQFWPDWIMVGVVAAVFFTGQFIEGNILQPKLVGSSVGLHPVWLMFALFAFGSLLGFTGMLIAVPAAAAVGVLVRFALRSYLASPMYKSTDTKT